MKTLKDLTKQYREIAKYLTEQIKRNFPESPDLELSFNEKESVTVAELRATAIDDIHRIEEQIKEAENKENKYQSIGFQMTIQYIKDKFNITKEDLEAKK